MPYKYDRLTGLTRQSFCKRLKYQILETYANRDNKPCVATIEEMSCPVALLVVGRSLIAQ